MPFQAAQSFNRFAAANQGQIGVHFRGGAITVRRVAMARLHQHGIQLEQRCTVWQPGNFGRQLGKLTAVAAHAHFVEHLGQAVEVGLRCAGTFRSDVTGRAGDRKGFVERGDQSDVGQLGQAFHEDNVGWLDVAVDQAMPVEVFQRGGEAQGNPQALLHRQWPTLMQFVLERAGDVTLRIQHRGWTNRLATDHPGVIGEFHHVVEIAPFLVPAHMEHRKLGFVPARNRLESPDPFELPFGRSRVLEGMAGHNLDRPVSAHDRSRQPNLAKTPVPDALDQFVVRDEGKLGRKRRVQAVEQGGPRRRRASRGGRVGRWLRRILQLCSIVESTLRRLRLP